MKRVTAKLIVSGKVFENIERGFEDIHERIEKGLISTSVPLTKIMREALQLVARNLAKTHSKPWNGGLVNNGDTLQRRSGGIRNLARNIKVSRTASGTIEGQIGLGRFAIHETGGTIKAKRSRYLTIPLPAALNGSGVPLKKRARDWDNTFVARSRRGNLLIFRKEVRGGVTPLYLLKPSVKIPARLGMEKAIINDALPYFERKAFEVISAAIG